MSEKAFKRTERAVAARLGGKRVPITGRQRGDVPDVAHPLYSVEVKHRQSIPAWLKDAVSQAVAASTPQQIPIVVLHEAGQRHGNDLVVIPLSEFTAWYGAVSTPEGEMLG